MDPQNQPLIIVHMSPMEAFQMLAYLAGQLQADHLEVFFVAHNIRQELINHYPEIEHLLQCDWLTREQKIFKAKWIFGLETDPNKCQN